MPYNYFPEFYFGTLPRTRVMWSQVLYESLADGSAVLPAGTRIVCYNGRDHWTAAVPQSERRIG